MDRRFDVPTPGRGREGNSHLWREVSRVGGCDHWLRRRCRMEVERHLECFGTLQDRPEEWVVKVAAPDMAIYQCSFGVGTDGTFQLVGGGVGAAVGSAANPANRLG